MIIRPNNYSAEWDDLNLVLESNSNFENRMSCLLSEDLKGKAGDMRQAMKDKVNIFKKLYNKIKELWMRFLSRATNFVKGDQKWLSEFEDRIIKADLSAIEYKIFPYWKGGNIVQQTKVPAFNPGDNALMSALDNIDSFRAKYIPRIKAGKESSLVEDLKNAFRGGDYVTIKSNQINVQAKRMIAFCKSYNSLVGQIRADYNNIDKVAKMAIKEAELAAQVAAHTSTTNSIQNNSAVLFEDTPTTDKGASEGDARHKEKTDTKNDEKDFTDRESDNKAKVASNKITKYNNYISYCQKVLGAKMSILEERYNEYMKLLKLVSSKNPMRAYQQEKVEKKIERDELSPEDANKLEKTKDILENKVKELNSRIPKSDKKSGLTNVKKSLEDKIADIDKALSNKKKQSEADRIMQDAAEKTGLGSKLKDLVSFRKKEKAGLKSSRVAPSTATKGKRKTGSITKRTK